MYFWRDDLLFNELQANTVSEREKVKYFILNMLVLELAMWVIATDPGPIALVDHLDYLSSCLLVIFGTLFAFKKYSPPDRFVERFLCLSVPILIRLLAVSMPIMVIFELLVYAKKIPETMPFNLFISLVINFWFYFRLIRHMEKFHVPSLPVESGSSLSGDGIQNVIDE